MERPVDTYQIHLCYLRPHCLIDFLSEWSVHNVNRMLKSSTIILLLSVSPFMSVNICFIYLSAPVLGAYMLMNVVSFYFIDLFILYNTFVFVVHFVLKSILSSMSVTTPDFLSFPFA